MTGPELCELIVREPSSPEADRALYLFRAAPLPRQARVFVAVKTRPLERFVAAVAWWLMGDKLCFRLAAQPGSADRFAACGKLIEQVVECARVMKMGSIHYADLLADNSEWVPFLKANEFIISHSERFFETPARESWTRTMKLAERMRDKFPPSWRTESIRHHQPETILDFIEPCHLMPADEVRDRWRENCAYGFELDLSSILFDGARPIGAFLGRRLLDTFYVDVRMVRAENPLLNSLGNVALLHHTAAEVGPTRRGYNKLQFRAGQIEHRETANLALRMGGSELPPRHFFSRAV